MKQSALERSVAQATGESVTRIRHIGFSLVRMPERSIRTDLVRAASPERSAAPIAGRLQGPHCC